jgi:hypothetical protein
MHGGKSTGARTPEGLRRCRTARLVHGCRTRELIDLRSRAAHAARRLRRLTALARSPLPHGLSAWHGLDRPKVPYLMPDPCHPSSGSAWHGLDRPECRRRAA